MASVTWRTSSHSNDIDACIEVAGLAGSGWAVRDSKDPRGAVLMFTAADGPRSSVVSATASFG
jgi:hypothetical protein